MADFVNLCKLGQKSLLPISAVTTVQNVVHMHHDATLRVLGQAGLFLAPLKRHLFCKKGTQVPIPALAPSL
jgi:hypothetical protein